MGLTTRSRPALQSGSVVAKLGVDAAENRRCAYPNVTLADTFSEEVPASFVPLSHCPTALMNAQETGCCAMAAHPILFKPEGPPQNFEKKKTRNKALADFNAKLRGQGLGST